MSLDQQNLSSCSTEDAKVTDNNDKIKSAHFAAPLSDDQEDSYNKNDNDNKSFGMQLGQIQNKSISLMKEIMLLEPTVKEISLKEIPEEAEEQKYNNKNENRHNKNDDNANSNSESAQLFGRLDELDEDLTNGIVYQPLLTGVINQSDDLSEIKRKLRAIADICIDFLWIDETAYVNQLLDSVNFYLSNGVNNNSNIENNTAFNNSSNLKRTGFWRQNPQEDIEKIYNEMGEDFRENFDKELEDFNNHRIEVLNEIDAQYAEESAKLDEKYQNPSYLASLPFARPSKELLDLRYKAKKLLKQNRIKEATEITNKIKIKERTEAAENSQKVREKYYADDRRLKEQYAIKRHNAELKFDLEVSRLNSRKKKKIQMYENYISKLKRQIEHDNEISSLNNYQANKQNEKSLNDRENHFNDYLQNSKRVRPINLTERNNEYNSSFMQYGQFEPKAPKLLDRRNDLLILNQMTEDLLNKTASSPRKSNIDKIFRESNKNKK